MKSPALMLSFVELRAIAVAIYEHGKDLRVNGETFSHGNTGWDWMDLAHKIDKLVSEGEKDKMYLLCFSDNYVKAQEAAAEVEKVLRDRINELGKDVIDFNERANHANRAQEEAENLLADRDGLLLKIRLMVNGMDKPIIDDAKLMEKLEKLTGRSLEDMAKGIVRKRAAKKRKR